PRSRTRSTATSTSISAKRRQNGRRASEQRRSASGRKRSRRSRRAWLQRIRDRHRFSSEEFLHQRALPCVDRRKKFGRVAHFPECDETALEEVVQRRKAG